VGVRALELEIWTPIQIRMRNKFNFHRPMQQTTYFRIAISLKIQSMKFPLLFDKLFFRNEVLNAVGLKGMTEMAIDRAIKDREGKNVLSLSSHKSRRLRGFFSRESVSKKCLEYLKWSSFLCLQLCISNSVNLLQLRNSRSSSDRTRSDHNKIHRKKKN